MSRDDIIQKIIEVVKEAQQKNYSDYILKRDLNEILDLVEEDIKEYNEDALEDLRTSYRNSDSDYCSYDEILDQIRNSLY